MGSSNAEAGNDRWVANHSMRSNNRGKTPGVDAKTDRPSVNRTASYCTDACKGATQTHAPSSMVMLVSAMFVAITTLRTPCDDKIGGETKQRVARRSGLKLRARKYHPQKIEDYCQRQEPHLGRPLEDHALLRGRDRACRTADTEDKVVSSQPTTKFATNSAQNTRVTPQQHGRTQQKHILIAARAQHKVALTVQWDNLELGVVAERPANNSNQNKRFGEVQERRTRQNRRRESSVERRNPQRSKSQRLQTRERTHRWDSMPSTIDMMSCQPEANKQQGHRHEERAWKENDTAPSARHETTKRNQMDDRADRTWAEDEDGALGHLFADVRRDLGHLCKHAEVQQCEAML
jgi:hypothetical protein